ncbi:MAG: hypothetical protein BA863_18290 [Desulfovibrio sp. S3730MH75]|nr:MAG: hypothetical protein BA863_18290 [Desulfovibrio sp. S3730MH75]
MTTEEVISKLDLKPLSKFNHRDVNGVFVSDMLSDVMAGAQSGNLWVTIQTHKSIIPAANLVDVSAIIITSGKQISQETEDFANQYDIAVLSTELSTFEMVGKLYALGLVNQ